MKVLNTTILVLTNVINNNEDFYRVLRRTFESKDINSDEKKMITAFSGCILRHYLSFADLLKRHYKEESDELKYAIMFMISNVVFLKRIEEDKWISLLHEYIKVNNFAVDANEITQFVKSRLDGVALIDESIERTSDYFCSLRFNLPVFLTKMWSRAYGKNLTFKIAKGIAKSPKQIVRLNTLKMSKEDFETKFSKEFVATEVEGLYQYIGTNPLKRLPLYQNKKIFAVSFGLEELIKELDIDPIKTYALYSGSYNPLFLSLNVSSGNIIKIENLLEPKKDYHLFKNEMKQFGFINNSLIECAPSSIIASLSKKVDTFIVYPSNSSFEQLRLSPDYFLKFDSSSFDKLINEQKELINEAKNFVNENGCLVYVVNTISKKESVNIIKEFLTNNSDFYLEKEKQYFPFEKEDSTLYYAILRKKGQND